MEYNNSLIWRNFLSEREIDIFFRDIKIFINGKDKILFHFRRELNSIFELLKRHKIDRIFRVFSYTFAIVFIFAVYISLIL